MFYTFAEKRGDGFFDTWHTRQIAFDSMRRYLYYSAPQSDASPPASPSVTGETLEKMDMRSVTSLPSSSPTARTGPSYSLTHSPQTAGACLTPQARPPTGVHWSKKVKVNRIAVVAQESLSILQEEDLKEASVLLLEIHGESRVLQTDESPAPGPMLVPSASWDSPPRDFSAENEDYVKDPFFLQELYEALRAQFVTMRTERETLISASGKPADPRFEGIQTIYSPRGKDEPLVKGSRMKVTFRMRSEFDLRRFWYVVRTVLGYDKLCTRPFFGYPPYDPRNGLMFSLIPLYTWQTFRRLSEVVVYAFARGDVTGHNSSGELIIVREGAFLCITHDMVRVLSDKGTVVRNTKMDGISRVEFGVSCKYPYIAFLSDSGAADIVFIMQPPLLDKEAIEHYDGKLETLRVVHVMRSVFFASLDVRRVITICEAPEPSVRAFVTRVESDLGRKLDFGPRRVHNAPSDTPRGAWAAMRDGDAQVRMVLASRSAIPLFRDHPNSDEFEPALLDQMEAHLTRSRTSEGEIVGMTEISQTHLRSRLFDGQADSTSNDVGVARLGSSTGSSPKDESTDGNSEYGIPGSAYYANVGLDVASPSSPDDAVEEPMTTSLALNTEDITVTADSSSSPTPHLVCSAAVPAPDDDLESSQTDPVPAPADPA